MDLFKQPTSSEGERSKLGNGLAPILGECHLTGECPVEQYASGEDRGG